jgi:16S rRNA G1207 methylase RsmC
VASGPGRPPELPPEILRLKEDIVFSARLRGHDLTFHSTWGLFSPREIDDGTRLLLDRLAVRPDDVTLDLGCGYGALGIAIARDTPAGEVHLVDKDVVALGYAEKNVAANGLANCRVYASNAFAAVPAGVRFDNVISNLPAKVGNELLSIMLHDAHRHLRPGGQICLVTISGLRQWVKRNLREVFGTYEKVKQGRRYTVARAVRGG